MPTFDWNGYHKLAEELLGGSPQDEATWRTAVSRAYYATYHTCLTAARSHCPNHPDIRGAHVSHSDLLVWYQRGPAASPRFAIGQGLRTLLEARTKADYDGQDKVVNDRMARSMVQLARNVIKSARAFQNP